MSFNRNNFNVKFNSVNKLWYLFIFVLVMLEGIKSERFDDDWFAVSSNSDDDLPLHQKTLLSLVKMMQPLQRPPFSESILVSDGSLAYDTSSPVVKRWKDKKDLVMELQANKVKRVKGSNAVDEIIKDYNKLIENNPEVEKYVEDSRTGDYAKHAVFYLGQLSDSLSHALHGLHLKHGRMTEFTSAYSALMSCLTFDESSFTSREYFRIEIVDVSKSSEPDERAPLFIILNRSYYSSLHFPKTWGVNAMIVSPWYSDKVFTVGNLPEIIEKIEWDNWRSRDFTPPNLVDAPPKFKAFMRESIRKTFGQYQSSFPLGLTRFSLVCNTEKMTGDNSDEKQPVYKSRFNSTMKMDL